jgi:hypothetical protein
MCKDAKRQTINAEDVFKALDEIDFPEFVEPLRTSLEGQCRCLLCSVTACCSCSSAVYIKYILSLALDSSEKDIIFYIVSNVRAYIFVGSNDRISLAVHIIMNEWFMLPYLDATVLKRTFRFI